MAVPTFLNTAFRYKQTLAVVDVNTIISDLDTELTSLPDPWTRPGATGPWTSPARSDGASMKIAATRISATRVAWVVTDMVSGLQINNATDTRQDIDAGGTTINYYTGPMHVAISSERATPEAFCCGMLDQTPQSFSVPRSLYFSSQTPRNNAGTLAGTSDSHWLLLSAGTAYTNTTYGLGKVANFSSAGLITVSGALLFSPLELGSTSAINISMGRLFQALVVDSSQSFAAEFSIPIDSGPTLATFKVIGMPTGSTQSTYRVAYRKA